jgi:hypothetical protein
MLTGAAFLPAFVVPKARFGGPCVPKTTPKIPKIALNAPASRLRMAAFGRSAAFDEHTRPRLCIMEGFAAIGWPRGEALFPT